MTFFIFRPFVVRKGLKKSSLLFIDREKVPLRLILKYSDDTIDQPLIINTETFALECIENLNDYVRIAIKNYENDQRKYFHREYF